MLGEFQTLVNPHTAIPAFIAVLTGITNGMVADAPPITSALPAFLEFARGSVLVAHNARFDVGFLRHFAQQQDIPWPDFEVVDTVKVARRVVTRDEAPNHKLSSLARVFRSGTTPNHRALADARATVDVLHGLMERLGSLGVHTLEELQTYSVARSRPRSAASATSPTGSPMPPASTSSATSSPGCSTSARPRTCASGSAPTSPPPRPAPGSARWSGSRRRSPASSARRRSRPRSASCG